MNQNKKGREEETARDAFVFLDPMGEWVKMKDYVSEQGIVTVCVLTNLFEGSPMRKFTPIDLILSNGGGFDHVGTISQDNKFTSILDGLHHLEAFEGLTFVGCSAVAAENGYDYDPISCSLLK